MNAIDILSFDAVAASSAAYKLPLKHPDGEATGITLHVLGKHADVVAAWTSGVVNKMFRDAEYAKKRGKSTEPDTIEEIRERNLKGALIRVVGWDGVKQEFSADLMEKALRRNPHWIDQIIEASDDLANFPGAKSGN